MRIWFATEFYESRTDTVGGYYVQGIAEKLASTDNVEVVCPSKERSDSVNLNSNIRIRYIHQFDFNRKNLFIRTLGQLIMTFQFFLFLLPKAKKDDIVVSFTHPSFMIFACIILKKLKGIRVAVVNYDLFPEILIGTGASEKTLFYKSILAIYNKAYNNVDILVSLGEDMTRNLKAKIQNDTTRIYTIPNWADTVNINFRPKESNEIINRYGLGRKIVFSYAGTIGRCQGIEKLLDLIERMDYADNVHFLFFGKGVGIDSFLNLVSKNRNQKLITYGGFIVTDDRNDFLNACDVAIISLLEGMTGLNFPSKTYNILASGHPILFVGKEDFELAEMIKSFDIGWVCSQDDHCRFQEIINDILSNPEEMRRKGENARKTAELHFPKEKIVRQYAEVLKS